MLVDRNKTAVANLLDLLNTTNGTEYTAADVYFGNPKVYTDPAYPAYNTEIEVTGIGDWSGTMSLYYTRLDLKREILYRNYEGGGYSTMDDLMTYLAERNDVRGDQIQLDTVLPPNGSVEVKVRVMPVSDSLLYIGERTLVFAKKAT